MQLRRSWLALISVTVLAAVAAARADDSTSSQTVAVAETYNKKPFEYTMKLLAQRDGFRVYRLTYPSPVVTSVEANNTVRADLYLPDNISPSGAKRPAVISLHILNGDMRVTDVACSVLARRGIPAIMPTLPYYGQRAKNGKWDTLLKEPQLFLGMLLQSIEDIRRTADLLASRPEVDPQRINISGVSLGGIVAASVAATDTRIYRTSLFLAGGDLLKILNHARYTRGLSEQFRQLPKDERTAIESRVAAVDPIQLAPALRDRAQQGRVLMVNAADDEIIPRASTEKLATALGILDRVTWIDNLEHDRFIAALPLALRMTTEFFAQDLPADVKPAERTSAEAKTPSERASSLIHQLTLMMTTEPSPGHCHAIDMEITADSKDQKPFTTRAQWIRGTDERFKLKCRLPIIGDVTTGQNAFPWMLTSSKVVMQGVKNPTKNRNPLQFADRNHLANLRNVVGLVESLDLVPDSLTQWTVIEEKKTSSAPNAVRLTVREKFPCSVTVSFKEDGKTPGQIEFDGPAGKGKMVIHDWKVNAVAKDSDFDAPKSERSVEMDQADLYRAFGSFFNMAMQQVK